MQERNVMKKKTHSVYLDEVLYHEIKSFPIKDAKTFSEKVSLILNDFIKVNGRNNSIYSDQKRNQADDKIKFIDLFAGIGGIRLGFEGVSDDTKCVYSSEWDKFSQKTYQANFDEIPDGDITKIEAKNIPNFDVLLAGFPCQPFSSIGQREGFENETQGTLFFDVLRILKYHMPKSFLLENVPGLLTIQKGETFKIIMGALSEAGYNVQFSVLNASDFGLAQSRKRVVIVGFRNDLDATNFNFPTGSSNKVAIKDILEKNPKGYSISKRLQESYLFKKDDGHPYIIDQKSNGQAKTLNASYHKIQRVTGTFVRGGETGIRLLSETECKRLQGFPDDFKLPVSRTQMYRQMGNSVAIPMIKAVADNMKKVLYNNYKELENTEEITLFS